MKIAVRYSPKLLEAHALLGRAYLHANQPALAIPELEKALALDYYGDLHFQLYKACLATGDTAAAQRALAISKEMRKKTVNAEAAKLGSGAGEPSPKEIPTSKAKLFAHGSGGDDSPLFIDGDEPVGGYS